MSDQRRTVGDIYFVDWQIKVDGQSCAGVPWEPCELLSVHEGCGGVKLARMAGHPCCAVRIERLKWISVKESEAPEEEKPESLLDKLRKWWHSQVTNLNSKVSGSNSDHLSL